MLHVPTGRPLVVLGGTRPEIIKLAPVVKALRSGGHNVKLVLSGQHPALATTMLHEAGLEADRDLGIHLAGAGPDQLLAKMLDGLRQYLHQINPAMMIVQGDTLTTLAGAMSAAYARIPVVHIEAGLRTGDNGEPFPEEMHRTMITRIAELHLAPTEGAASRLRSEGVQPDTIHVTGNTGIDALRQTMEKLEQNPDYGASLAEAYPFIERARRPIIVATLHRRENIGSRLQSVAAALARLVGFFDAEVVLPLHPNPAVRMQLSAHLQGLKGCHMIEPVEHMAMVWMLQKAQLLLTDSGGLQEEAPTIGVRTLILRKTTERPEGIEAGAAQLVDLCADAIVEEARAALSKPRLQPCYPYGDGYAARRITAIIEDYLGMSDRRMSQLA